MMVCWVDKIVGIVGPNGFLGNASGSFAVDVQGHIVFTVIGAMDASKLQQVFTQINELLHDNKRAPHQEQDKY
jgi:hypothetical protein